MWVLFEIVAENEKDLIAIYIIITFSFFFFIAIRRRRRVNSVWPENFIIGGQFGLTVTKLNFSIYKTLEKRVGKSRSKFKKRTQCFKNEH